MRRLAQVLSAAVLAALSACSDDAPSPDSWPSVRGSQTAEDSVDPEQRSVTAPVPPYGEDYVGLGRVAVLVPSGMSAQTIACSRGTMERGPCVELTAQAKTPALTVTMRPYDQIRSEWFALEPLTTRSGLEALVGDACPTIAYCAVQGLMLTVPEENFALVATGGPKAQSKIRAIVRSVRLLPSGYTAVPPVARGMETEDAVALLTRAGFDVDAPTPSPAYYAWDTSPAAGTVVREGSGVTVHVGDG